MTIGQYAKLNITFAFPSFIKWLKSYLHVYIPLRKVFKYTQEQTTTTKAAKYSSQKQREVTENCYSANLLFIFK